MKSKKILIAVLGIIGIVLVTAGVTYAFFSYTRKGTTDNTITAGAITFHYQEGSRGISLDDALPLTDSQGKTQSKYFDFDITSTTMSNAEIPYTVTARVNSNSTLDPSIIKIWLSDQTDTEIEVVKYFDEPKVSTGKTWLSQYSNVDANTYMEKVIYTGTVPANSGNYEKNFRLRMWIDEETDFSGVETTKYYCDGTEVVYGSEAYTACDTTKLTQQTTMEYPYNDKEFSITINVYANAELVTVPEEPDVVAFVPTNFAFGYFDSNDELLAASTTDYTTLGNNVFAGLGTDNSLGVCINDNGLFCLKTSDYDNTVANLKAHFGEDSCTASDSNVNCYNDDFACDADSDGYVRCYDNWTSVNCLVYADGSVYCG